MAYIAHPVFSFGPNWDEGVLERLEWRTSAMISEIGAEQRVPTRLTPRRGFEISLFIQQENRQYFQHLVGRYSTSVWLIPLWHQVSSLGASAALGTDTLTFDTRWREFKVGDLVILRNRYDARIWEAIEIEAITDSTLTLISNLEKNWPAGAIVYPGRLARIQDMVSGSKKTDQFFEVKMRFSLVEKNPYTSEWTPTATYQDAPVFDQRPDDSEDLTFDFTTMTKMVDNELGIPAVVDVAGRPFRRMQYRWSFAGRQANHEFRQLLYYLKGRFRSVWIPTFLADLTIAANVTNDDSNLTIKKVGYVDADIVNLPWKDIRIELRNGTILYSRIVASAAVDANTEQIGLETPIAEGFLVSEVARISYLMKVRLDQDSIEINHACDTDGLTQTVVTWYELAADIPEPEVEEPEDWGDLWLTSMFDFTPDNNLSLTDNYLFMENENELLIPVYSEFFDVVDESTIYGLEWRRHSADDFEFIDPIPGKITGVTVANPSGTITRMTKTAHGLLTGDIVVASEFSAWLNGAWHITVVDANNFNLNGAVWETTADATGTVTLFTENWDLDNDGAFIDDPEGYVWLCGAYSAHTYKIDKTTWAMTSVARAAVAVPVDHRPWVSDMTTLTAGYFRPTINPYNNDVYMSDLDAYNVMHRMDKASPTYQPEQTYFFDPLTVDLESPYSGQVDTVPYYDGGTDFVIGLGRLVFVSATEAYMNDYSNSNIFHIDLTTGVATYVFRLVNGAGNFSQHHPLYYDGPTNTLWFWGSNNSWYEEFLGTPVLTMGSLRAWVVGADPSTIIDYPQVWDHQMTPEGTFGDQDASELADPVMSVDKFNRGVWIGYPLAMTSVIPWESAASLRLFSFVTSETTHRVGDNITPTPGFDGSFGYSGSTSTTMVSATRGWCLPKQVWLYPSSTTDYRAIRMDYSAARVLEIAKYVRITIYGNASQAHSGSNTSVYSTEAEAVALQEIEVHSELNGANIAVSVTATSSEAGFPVTNLLDENLLDPDNGWRANTMDYPQVLTISLGPDALPVYEVQMWPINDRHLVSFPGFGSLSRPQGAYAAPGMFDIDVSVDGDTWTHKRRYQGITSWALGIDAAEDAPAARVFEAF